MSDLNNFKFKNITPNPDKYYRVSWYGSISYSDGEKNRPTPIMEVSMDELKADPSPKGRILPSHIAKDQTTKVRVPISLLAFLHLGDIWKDGKLYQPAEKNHSVCQFTNINITDDSHTDVKANHKYADEQYLLPLSIHPYHLNFTRSWCERLELGNNKLLIIPHMVLIQMFFSPDTFVLEQAFQSGLTLDTICDQKKSHYDPQSGKVFVQLRRQVTDASHKACASILFDKRYSESYKSVSKSLSSQKAQGANLLTPQIRMPIGGKQTLTAAGQWIKYPDESSAFLVLKLLSSNYAPPFQDITFFRDAPGDRNPDAKPPRRGHGDHPGGGRNRQKPNPTNDPLDIDPDKDPNGDYEPVDLPLSSFIRFPQLTQIPSKKERQEKHKNDEVNPKKPLPEDVDEAGAGGKGNDNGPGVNGKYDDNELLAETSETTFDRPFSRVDLFVSVLQELNSLKVKGAQVFYVDRYKQFEFPQVKLSSRNSTWDNLNFFLGDSVSQEKPYKPRTVLVSKIRLVSGITYYLFEAERKMKLAANGWYEVDALSILAIRQNQLTNRNIRSILESTTENRGWPKPVNPASQFLIRHSDGPTIVNYSIVRSKYSKHLAKQIHNRVSEIENFLAKQKAPLDKPER